MYEIEESPAAGHSQKEQSSIPTIFLLIFLSRMNLILEYIVHV